MLRTNKQTCEVVNISGFVEESKRTQSERGEEGEKWGSEPTVRHDCCSEEEGAAVMLH